MPANITNGERDAGPYGTRSSNRLELLDASAAELGDIDIALRIDGDTVRVVELPREVSGPTETRKVFACLALDDLDLRAVLIDHVHEPLHRVARQGERHRCPAGPAGVGGRAGARGNIDIPQEHP